MDGILSSAVALYAFAGISNCLGLLLLTRAKPQPYNQRIILQNLALVEIVYSFLSIPHTVYEGNNLKWCLTYDFLWALVYTVFQLTILHIITDKTASIYFHLRYNAIFSKKRLRLVLVSFWIFGCMLALMIVLIEIYCVERKLVQKYWTYSYFAFDIFIAFNLLIQFVYLYKKAKKIRCCINENKTIERKAKENALRIKDVSKFLLPAVIVGTYVLFCLTASTLYLLAKTNRKSKELYVSIAHFFEVATIISDVCTYVFLQRQVRKYLYELFLKRD